MPDLLIKQKQTQAWKTTGSQCRCRLLDPSRRRQPACSTKLVEVSLDGKKVEPKTSRPAPDFISRNLARGEITSALGQVQMTKHDAGVHGAAHWQYLEDMSKVTPHTATAALGQGDLHS